MEQTEEIFKELKKPEPRKSKVQVTGIGLIEAAKALSDVAPKLISAAKKIANFIATLTV